MTESSEHVEPARGEGDDWARPIVHWAIEAIDPDRQRRFYENVFNWTISDGHVMLIESGLGGPEPGPAGHIQPGSMSRVSLYVQVRDLTETLERVTANGGIVRSEPFDLPGAPTMAMIEDPEMNPLMLVQQ